MDKDIAGRMQMIQDLLNPEPYIDENGNIVQPEPLITPAEARKLLGFE